MLDHPSPITTTRATRASTALLKQQQHQVKPKNIQSPPSTVHDIPIPSLSDHESHTETPSTGKAPSLEAPSLSGDGDDTNMSGQDQDLPGPKNNNALDSQLSSSAVHLSSEQLASPDISDVEKLVSHFLENDDPHQPQQEPTTAQPAPLDQPSDHIDNSSLMNEDFVVSADNWPVPYPPIQQDSDPSVLENGVSGSSSHFSEDAAQLDDLTHSDAFNNDMPPTGLNDLSTNNDSINQNELTWANHESDAHLPAMYDSQDGETSPNLHLTSTVHAADERQEELIPPTSSLDQDPTTESLDSNPLASSTSPLSSHRKPTPSISSPSVRSSGLLPPHPMDANSDSPLRRGIRLSPSWASETERNTTPLHPDGVIASSTSPPVRGNSVPHSAFHPPIVVRNDGPLTASIIEHEKEEQLEMKQEADRDVKREMSASAGSAGGDMEGVVAEEATKIEEPSLADGMVAETNGMASNESPGTPVATDEPQTQSNGTSTTMATDNTVEDSSVGEAGQGRQDPANVPPPSPAPRFAGDPKVAIVLEINHELIGICMTYGGQPGQPPSSEVEPYHSRMTSNLNWLASVADSNTNQIKPGTQFALPNLQAPPPLPPSSLSVQLASSLQKLPQLYAKMHELFKVDYERRMRREAKLKMARSVGMNGSTIPAAIAGTKRDRPDGEMIGISAATGDLRKRVAMEGAAPNGPRITGVRSTSVSSVNSPVMSANGGRNPAMVSQVPPPTPTTASMQSSPAQGIGGVVGISTPFQQRQQPYQMHQAQTSPSPVQQHFLTQNTNQPMQNPPNYSLSMASPSPSTSNSQHGMGLGVMMHRADPQTPDRHQVSFENISSQSVNKPMTQGLSQNPMIGGPGVDGLSASAHLLNHGVNPVPSSHPELNMPQSNSSPTSLLSTSMPMAGQSGATIPSPQHGQFLGRAPSLGIGVGGQQGLGSAAHLAGPTNGLQSHEANPGISEEQQRLQMQFRAQMSQSQNMAPQLFQQSNAANVGGLPQMNGTVTNGGGIMGNLHAGNPGNLLHAQSGPLSNGMAPTNVVPQNQPLQQQEIHGVPAVPSMPPLNQQTAHQIMQILQHPGHPLTSHLMRSVRGFGGLPDNIKLQMAHRLMQQQPPQMQQQNPAALTQQGLQGQQQQQVRPPSASGIRPNIAGLRALRQGTSSPRMQGTAAPQAPTPPSSLSKPPSQHPPHPSQHQRQPSGGFLSSPVPATQSMAVQQGLGPQQRSFMMQHQHQQRANSNGGGVANSPPSSGGMEPPPNPTPLQLHQSMSRRTRSPSDAGSPHQQQHFQTQQPGSSQGQQHSPVSMSGRQQSPYAQFQNQQLPMQSVQQPSQHPSSWANQSSYVGSPLNPGWGTQPSAAMTPQQHKSAANSPYTGAGMSGGFTIAASPSAQQHADLLQSQQHMMEIGDTGQEHSVGIDPSALFNWTGGGGHGM
ncbi:hypothetical protein FRC03_006631 [Tulasnella sp. 419]|nr:hypothetical protein FRC03_006631 [Tulasnella sp. 419]